MYLNWIEIKDIFLFPFVDNLLWLFCFCRYLPVLLDSLLCPPHNESPLSWLPRPAGPDERGDVARLRQQRSQPRHLHRLQHRVQELLQKVSTSLLLQERLIRTRCRCRTGSTFKKTSESILVSVDLNVASVSVLCEVLFLVCWQQGLFELHVFREEAQVRTNFRGSTTFLHHGTNENWFFYAKCIFSE